jgi:hypothetical protein
MSKLTSPLDHLKIAAPCPADWDQMFSFEDERVRFCSQCNLNVYNLSNMSRQEAEDLITKTEGRLCVRFYRRADGSVLTQNCPVGLKALKRRVAWVAQVILGMVLSFVSGLGLYIFHLGRKPFPPLETGQFFQAAEIGGMVVRPISEVHPQVGEPRLGKVKIEPRQHDRVHQNEAKRQAGDQLISQDK